MGHPVIENETPFAFAPAFLSDENGDLLFVPIIKATFHIAGLDHLLIAEEQAPVNFSGEFWGDPDKSSYKYEPEGAFIKQGTDTVLVGHGLPQRVGDTEVLVGLRIGSLQKAVRVTGDRSWVKGFSGVRMTAPRPFDRIPLIYERAFGGWDHAQGLKPAESFEARNPLGVGYRVRWNDAEEAVPVPNIDDPNHRISSFEDRPPPVGFGFLGPNWQPRAAYAGTYDEAWMTNRMPLLPRDFDRRFLNGAPADQIVSGFLRGNEPVIVSNASPRGRLFFQLPGFPPPTITVKQRGGQRQTLNGVLDTLIINTDEHLVFMLWRAQLSIRENPEDVISACVVIEGLRGPAKPLPIAPTT